LTETIGLLPRIDKLESENRKIKWSCLILLLLVIALLVSSHTGNRGKIEVTELTVKDDSGTVIARLGADKHGSCLELTVRSGVSRAALCVDNFYGANLDLKNNSPETAASLSAGRKLYEGGSRLEPGLIIRGEGGQDMLAVNVGLETRLLLGRSEEENSVLLSAGQKPSVRVLDAHGKPVLTGPH
jgi:hypothetical protein